MMKKLMLFVLVFVMAGAQAQSKVGPNAREAVKQLSAAEVVNLQAYQMFLYAIKLQIQKTLFIAHVTGVETKSNGFRGLMVSSAGTAIDIFLALNINRKIRSTSNLIVNQDYIQYYKTFEELSETISKSQTEIHSGIHSETIKSAELHKAVDTLEKAKNEMAAHLESKVGTLKLEGIGSKAARFTRTLLIAGVWTAVAYDATESMMQLTFRDGAQGLDKKLKEINDEIAANSAILKANRIF